MTTKLQSPSNLEDHTEGDPDGDHIKFTEVTPPQISVAVMATGTPDSLGIIRNWLEDERFALHTMEKNVAGGESPVREAQMCQIARLKQRYPKLGNPES